MNGRRGDPDDVGKELASFGRRLTRSVMARTSGPACDRAKSLLPELVDGSLAATEADLVRLHLGACPACASLERTMAWTLAELPRLGEVAAPAGFTAAVLGRTSRLAPVPRPAGSGRRAATPAVRGWQRLLLRPHFAQELAYAALLALLLLTATPVSPLRQVPGHALEVVQAGPGAVVPGVDAPLARAGAWVGGQARIAWQATWTAAADRVAGGAAAGAGELWRRGRASAPALRDLGGHVGGAAWSLLHLEALESYAQLSAARLDLRQLWQVWSTTRRSS